MKEGKDEGKQGVRGREGVSFVIAECVCLIKH